LNLPLINPGDRATVAGRTGSGKSTLGCFLLGRSPGNWLILNPKGTKAYNDLPGVNTIHGISLKKIDRSLLENRFTNLVPTVGQSKPDNLDALIMFLHSEYENMGLVIDELYTVHKNGQSGDGLTAWLTRGRELKQSYLGLTQRPAWISKFCFSESDYIGEMSLAMEADRKRMYEITGHPAMLEKLPPREWFWYDVSDDAIRKFGAVPLPKK
jgi:hypothetical protein